MISSRPPTSGPYAQPAEDVEHVQLRLRILDGEAEADLQRYIVRRVGHERAAAWGTPTRTSNPLRDLSAAVAVLYDSEPLISHPEAGGDVAEAMAATLRLSGLWAHAAEAQRLTEALNDCALRLDIDDAGRILWRVVTPDLLEGAPLPGQPGTPGLIREWRVRVIDGHARWLCDELSVLDPAAPHYRVLDERGADLTSGILGGAFDGDLYPYRYAPSPSYPLGRPFLPYSLRHANPAPRRLFSPRARIETVDGTLDAGALATMISHVTGQASFPFTYVINARFSSGVAEVTDERGQPIARRLILDPAMIHHLEQTDATAAPTVGVLRNETDPLMLQELAERQAGQLAAMWGLSPADLQRTAADSRSGVALMVSDQGRRRMQAARAPVYQPHDEILVGRVAALLNRRAVGGVTDRPEGGWAVGYQLSPLSPMERAQRQAEATALLDRGLISRAEARAMITGETATSSAQALATMQAAADAAAAAGGMASDAVALNGAQMAGLIDILSKVALGEMSKATAAALIPIAIPSISADAAESLAASQAAAPPTPRS